MDELDPSDDFLNALTRLGGSAGNQKLRDTLGWPEDRVRPDARGPAGARGDTGRTGTGWLGGAHGTNRPSTHHQDAAPT